MPRGNTSSRVWLCLSVMLELHFWHAGTSSESSDQVFISRSSGQGQGHRNNKSLFVWRKPSQSEAVNAGSRWVNEYNSVHDDSVRWWWRTWVSHLGGGPSEEHKSVSVYRIRGWSACYQKAVLFLQLACIIYVLLIIVRRCRTAIEQRHGKLIWWRTEPSHCHSETWHFNFRN